MCDTPGAGDRASSGIPPGDRFTDTCEVATSIDPAQVDSAFLEVGRLAVLGHLTRGVAHEVNNPLFVVLALVELMARAVEPGSQAAERLAQVHESGLEIRRLLAAVQELARAEVSPEPALVTVAPVLLDAVDLVRRVSLRKDLDLVERYDDAGAAVLASSGQLRLALLVILVDAQEATAEGGRIEVSTARRGDRVTVVTRWSGGARPPSRLELLEGLADAIVAAWGGTLRRTVRPGGAGEAVISLPRLESA